MLLNVPPPKDTPGDIVEDNSTKLAVNKKLDRAEVMEGFKENFIWAYRKCQDKPGGKDLIFLRQMLTFSSELLFFSLDIRI